MRVLSTQELQMVAAGSDNDFAEAFAEIMIEIFIEVIQELMFEMIVQTTVAAIHKIHDFYYPPQVISSSSFRPALAK